MCETCYEDLGRPEDWNPRVARALELIRALYETEPCAGPLHVELDDWNIEGPIRGDGEYGDDATDETRAAVEELVPLLDSMTVAERASALARYDGYLPTATEA